MPAREKDYMNPGRELDALIAEKVMGWKNIKGELYWLAGLSDRGIAEDVPYYSTDIAAAWEVFEKIKTLKNNLSIQISGTSDCPNLLSVVIRWYIYVADWENGDVMRFSVHESQLTAPHAICLAALKAIENKYRSNGK